jgi:hypothetical protein
MKIPVASNFPDLSNNEIQAFHEAGIIHAPRAFDGDSVLERYLEDLRWASRQLLRRAGAKVHEDWTLDQLLTNLLQVEEGVLPRFLNGLGSHPVKFVSGNLLKYDARLLKVLSSLFGDGVVLASPFMSDSLAFNLTPALLPARAQSKHQSLPIHQDFPYMMQSARQLVVWIPLSEQRPNVGGIHCWLGSHGAGIWSQRKTGDYYEVDTNVEVLDAKYSREFVPWQKGDLFVFDSMLLHQTVPNTSQLDNRIVQIFRFSDLNDASGERFCWRSTSYIDRSTTNRKAVSFEEIYPALAKLSD